MSHVHRERRRRRKTSQEERICSICSQAFKKAEHLARHFRSHTKERPFTCEVCGKFYARQDTLLRHSRSHHVNAEPVGRVDANTGDITGDSVFVPNQTECDVPQTPAISVPGQMIPIPEGFVPELPQTNDNPGLATISPFGPSPEGLPVEADRSIHDHADIVVAHLLSTGMDRTSPWPVAWDGQWDSDWTSWLTGTDFDLDAVNRSLLESTAPFPKDPTMELPDGPSIHPTPPEVAGGMIRKRWHTFSETIASSGRTTPDRDDNNSHNDASSYQLSTYADETYRQQLAENLRQRVQPGILPSTTFLDFCVQAYFTHFHSIFPLVHAPTFQPSKKNAVLLLSICSIGSLFLGSSRAMAHGISMFERLHKAILASWDTHITITGDPSLIALQASLIGQTFGLLVGRPKDLCGIEIFHGCIVAWARKAKLFNVVDSTDIQSLENTQELDAAWKAWIRVEEKKRIILAIHIHDVELAKLHHHEPILRHSIDKLPQISSPDLFAAPNAQAWKRLLSLSQAPVQHPSPAEPSSPLPPSTKPRNDFHSYTVLESIGALALEDRSLTTWPSTVEKCHNLLIQWYKKHTNLTHINNNCNNGNSKHDPFCLMILWHSTFMHLHTRFDNLECALGREGEPASQAHHAYATSWARSPDAKRTLIHAVLLQRHFRSMAIGAEPAIHVPMALYYCGIAWAAFTRFGHCPPERSLEALGFSELSLLGINQSRHIQELARGVQWGRAESGAFFKVIDLLGKVSHWKVAGSFAATLLAFVEGSQDLF